MKRKGFTLIELLIVVAIIGILAAIAIPNFLLAQTRAKVARVKADHQACATALESYLVDNNQYCLCGYGAGDDRQHQYLPNDLTTPVSYLRSVGTDVMMDPFRDAMDASQSRINDPDGTLFIDDDYLKYRYQNFKEIWVWDQTDPPPPVAVTNYAAHQRVTGEWTMSSAGPDRSYSRWIGNPYGISQWTLLLPYDPTNGTVSDGDILRTQKSAAGKYLGN